MLFCAPCFQHHNKLVTKENLKDCFACVILDKQGRTDPFFLGLLMEIEPENAGKLMTDVQKAPDISDPMWDDFVDNKVIRGIHWLYEMSTRTDHERMIRMRSAANSTTPDPAVQY